MVTGTPTEQQANEQEANEQNEQQVNEQWTVGELAAELGITTRTLRFYEDQGLISPARRGAARSYDHRDRARMRLILRGKRFGMSLAEIAEIVGMYDGAASSERRQLETLLARLNEIAADLRARQRDLARTLAEVGQVASQCRDRLAELSATQHPGAPATTSAVSLQDPPNDGAPVTHHSHRQGRGIGNLRSGFV
ncbi:MAG: MerR family transcriptional regulator [Frankiales bacterium]|nr:MerR family transcriptional regulator [Frankiales bacterium]